jgi:hypothetical protein
MKKNLLLAVVCVGVSAPALATPPAAPGARPPPCQKQSPERNNWPQGTLLWGSLRQVAGQEMSTVLASVQLRGAQLNGKVLKDVSLKGGRLETSSRAPEQLVGTIFQGKASDGQPVEVAVCDAQPTPEDPSQVWYRIQLWNTVSGTWESPCIATGRVPSPRALAVPGVWDERGARQEMASTFTFACENGAIAKCADWGYKPWAKKEGRSLADLHQACTRMARADYCGDGRSHTREDNGIDVYDSLKVMTRTTESSAAWDVSRASFEAAWSPDGAACLSRTREGQAVETVMAECPGRFELARKELGEGDACTVVRKGARAEAAVLRNHSYGQDEQASVLGEAK